MQDFLRKIQNSDERTKTKWLIIFCSITMTFVVGVWVIYMNSYVFHHGQATNAEEKLEVGFWPVFKNSISVAGGSVARKSRAFVSETFDKALKKENTIEINGN